MRRDFLLPQLALGDLPVIVSGWLAKPGSEVIAGDRLLEVLSGSIAIDLPAPATGILIKTLVDKDDWLITGQRLAVIEVEQD